MNRDGGYAGIGTHAVHVRTAASRRVLLLEGSGRLEAGAADTRMGGGLER